MVFINSHRPEQVEPCDPALKLPEECARQEEVRSLLKGRRCTRRAIVAAVSSH